MFLYLIIFFSKVIENAVATLRIIVVANGKKILGAILQGIVSIVWICITGVVVVNILKDPFKIVAFALGSIVGSYLGSIMEERIALGNKMLIAISSANYEENITKKIREQKFAVTSTLGKGRDQEKVILFILVPRKKAKEVSSLLKNIDPNILIISENAFHIYGGYLKKT